MWISEEDQAALMKAAPAEVEQWLEGKDADEGQKAFLLAAAWARALAAKPGYQNVSATLIALRQAYRAAYRDLLERVDKEPDPKPHPSTVDFIIQMAMHAGNAPFNEHTLVNTFIHQVFQWLTTLVDRHSAEDAMDLHITRQEAEKERRERPLPLPFHIDIDDKEPALPRDRSLVLAGDESAVLYLLDQTLNAVMTGRDKKDKFYVARLCVAPPGPESQHAGYVHFAPNEWGGCCNSRKRAEGFFAQIVERMGRAPDIVMCDDLAAAYTAGFTGRLAPANAGDAHRFLRMGCDAIGAAFVGGLPLAPIDMVFEQPQFENIRTFAVVRPVIVKEEEEKVVIGIARCLTTWEVEPSVLQSYGRRTVLAA